jgi:hypothetical protein
MHDEVMPMKLTAAQHVSATLTSMQSPSGEDGYQTLYYTRELLTQKEVNVIERLVQYSSASERRPKWQSYRLSARRHVLTRIVPVNERDDADRGNRYFTHSLIFELSDEQQFDASLLSLLRPEKFLSSLDDLLASAGMRTRQAPTLTVEVGGKSIEDGSSRLRDWPAEELNRLFMLMSDPRRLTDQGQYVALVGNDKQILEALKVAFLLAPPSALKFCSFDTNPSRAATPPDGPFWGRGGAATAEASYLIDAVRRQVIIPDESPLLARSHTELGLLLAMESGDDAARLRVLSALNDSSYEKHVEQLRRWPNFKPWHAFSPTFMSTWFDLFRGEYRLDDLTTAITIVDEHGSENDREYVEDIHKHLNADEKRELRMLLKASPLRLTRLQAALDVPASDGDQTGRSHSFWGRILNFFVRLKRARS